MDNIDSESNSIYYATDHDVEYDRMPYFTFE